MKLEEIIEDCGFGNIRVSAVHGGDINACYCLHQKEQKWFLKVNDAANYPYMFQKEANGLLALQQHTAFAIPSVVKHGVVNSKQYLLMEWIESGTPQPAFWKQFAHTLAAMHTQTQSFFGWTENNYIGSLPQINGRYTDWALFYSECRILPLVKILFNNGVFTKHDLINAGLVCQKFNTLFPNEPPALLHGGCQWKPCTN
jgi:fructosamine-3-kinase